MRKKNKGKEIFSFSSLSTPKEFLSRLCETAVQAKLGIELTEAGFNLQLKSHHTGWYVYRASVVANESGGSIVQGTIEPDLWAAGHNHSEKKKSFPIESPSCKKRGCHAVMPVILNLMFLSVKVEIT